ncbi:PTS sugar transporter subunit IIA [Enterococcus sp. LJL90]
MSVIQEEQIYLNQEFSDQDTIFKFLADQTVALGIANDAVAVYDSLKLRESEGTTGMMDGFAIPHAKTAAVEQASILILQLTQGINWESMDGQPTDFIIALFIPEAEVGATHLKLLSTIARMLMRSEFKDELKQAQTKAEIVALLNKNLSEEQ